MAFIDELKKQMSSVAQSAHKAAEIARLQRQVSLKQEEFEDLFREIGQMYYDGRKRSDSLSEEMDQRCERVDALAAEIEGLKLKLDDLKQIRRCAACGSIQNNEGKFCAHCGAKMEEREIPEEEPVEENAEAAEESAGEQQEETGKSIFISWPETSETAEEESEEESGEAKDEE